MTARPRLTNPAYTVIVGDPDAPDTWAELTVQTITADQLRAEDLLVRAKTTPQAAAIRFGIACAWAALVRTKQLPAGTSFEAFVPSCIDINQLEDATVRPTDPGPAPA